MRSSRIKFIWLIFSLLVGLEFGLSSAYAADNNNPDSQWIMRKDQNGVIEVMDVETAKYRDLAKTSKLPSPSQEMLDKALNDITRIRFINAGMSNGKLLGDEVQFESSDANFIEQLKGFLKINKDPRSFRHDACLGGPTLELYSGTQRKLLVGIHHGCMIRWSAWLSDACLLQPREFIAWLASHGVTGPQRELERSMEQAKFGSSEAQKARIDQFVQTMPTSLREFLGPLHIGYELTYMSDKYKAIPVAERMKAARTALARELPNKSEQISTLLEWSGAIYPGVAAYRMFPTELLLEYEPDDVLSIVKSTSLSPHGYVGASRYYSYMGFRDKFLYGYAPLDDALKQRIIKELEATGKNQDDIDEFKDAIKEWMPPIRLDRILEERREEAGKKESSRS